MIINFEEITKELSADERSAVSMLVKGFANYTKEAPIKAPDIIDRVNSKNLLRFKLSEPRLRKLCNFIRAKGLLPLIATSNGYYVSRDTEEIKKQIKSLEERAAAILNSAEGLKQYL